MEIGSYKITMNCFALILFNNCFLSFYQSNKSSLFTIIIYLRMRMKQQIYIFRPTFLLTFFKNPIHCEAQQLVLQIKRIKISAPSTCASVHKTETLASTDRLIDWLYFILNSGYAVRFQWFDFNQELEKWNTLFIDECTSRTFSSSSANVVINITYMLNINAKMLSFLNSIQITFVTGEERTHWNSSYFLFAAKNSFHC